MSTRFALITVLLTLAAGCSSTHRRDALGNVTRGEQVYCPVMGDEVDVEEARSNPGLHSSHDGKLYLFCCTGCKPRFDKDPAQYAENPVAPEVD